MATSTRSTQTPGARDSRRYRLLPATIRGRLVLLVLLAMVPLFILLGWVYHERYRSRHTEALQGEIEEAQFTGTAFAAFIEDLRRSSYLLGRALLSNSSEASAPRRLLHDVAEQYPPVTDVAWVGPAGSVLASGRSLSEGENLGGHPEIRAVIAGAEWALGRVAPAGTFTVARGIREADRRLLGVIVATVDPRQLWTLGFSTREPGSGVTSLFDGAGNLVLQNPDPAVAGQYPVGGRDALLQLALATGEMRAGVWQVGEGPKSEWLGARVPIPGTDWIAGASRPLSEALAPVHDRLRRDVLIGMALVILKIAIAYGFGRTITRPLQRLERDVARLRAGHNHARQDALAPVEVIQVRTAVQEMASELIARARSVTRRGRELERMNAELQEFVYVASHDLKGPLRALANLALLVDEDAGATLAPESRKHLRLMRERVKAMDQLLNGLLAYAEAGTGERRPTDLALADLLPRAAQDARLPAGFQLGWEPSLPTVHADPDELSRLLASLIANAAHHHDHPSQGHAVFSAHDVGDGWLLELADDGPGIPDHAKERVFRIFSTSSPATGRAGIGLAVARKLALANGGRLSVADNQPRGAVLRLYWPKTAA